MASNSSLLSAIAHMQDGLNKSLKEKKNNLREKPAKPSPEAVELPPTAEEELESLTCEHGAWADMCFECENK